MKRYTATPLYKRHYEVECPHCKHQAMVEGDKFVCTHCYRREYRKDKLRYACRAKLRCPSCDQQIESEWAALGKPLKMIIVRCATCHTEIETKASNTLYYLYPEKKNIKTDPLFGYALWYYSTFKGNDLWAYNRMHLNEIESFVEADIRKDSQNYYAKSITAWLPKYIVVSKNRVSILKTIKKMRDRKVE